MAGQDVFLVWVGKKHGHGWDSWKEFVAVFQISQVDSEPLEAGIAT